MEVYGRKKEEVIFTPSQKQAVDDLVGFIGQEWNERDYCHALSGAGGTGKTFVTKYVIDNCKYSKSVIACAAPTHKACRVLSNALGGMKVDTIQSLFGFRVDTNIDDFDPENPKFSPLGKIKLAEGNYRILIIDESSMLNAKLVKYIMGFCKRRHIKIVYVGDASQLPPVNESNSTAFIISTKTNHLTEIVRQENNNHIRVLLDILRNDIKNKTYKFFEYISNPNNKSNYNENGCGYTVCDKSEFDYLIEQSFNDKEFESNVDLYRVVAYTNAKVSYWNNYIRNNIVKGADKNIITSNDLITSYTTLVDEFNSIIINNSEDYIIKNIVDFVDPIYGFKTFMVKLQAIHGGKITIPLCIIDHSDKYTVQLYYKTLNNLIQQAKEATNSSSRSDKWSKYYSFKKRYLLATNLLNKNGKIIFSRDIDYGFAITSHRAQGSTYNTVFVDVNDMVFDNHGRPYTNQDELLRRLYVACSRPSSELILCYG